MQDTGKLVLGIDLCDDITQVTVMRPYGAEPDAVSFDVNTRKEYLPTLLCVGENGEWSIGEGKGVRSKMKEQLAKIRVEALAAFEQAADAATLDALRVQYLGKKGELTAVLKQMGCKGMTNSMRSYILFNICFLGIILYDLPKSLSCHRFAAHIGK